ncbi:MAG: 1-acyl-sn-glycerol-3-phosphate acyltransferase [Halobacteriovoraceae bacterium]|nr:1-acyl-sn-glycerol-3-phosphate acyltransferase [Halobacteriovoraceae bacterium]
MKKNIKFILFLLIIFFYIISALPFYIFVRLTPFKARKVLIRLVSFYSTLLLRVLNIKVTLKGDIDTFSRNQNHFITSNHLSYLDVLILSSIAPTCFVTSVEIKNTPGLGLLTLLGGCLYVERRNRKNLHREIEEVTQALENGLNVTVYPEATSSNGEKVLPFKRPLFQAAVDSNCPILILAINYTRINNCTFGPENRDKVCWYGDMDFLGHFISLCECDRVNVQINVCESIQTTHNDKIRSLSERAFETTSLNFRPVLN